MLSAKYIRARIHTFRDMLSKMDARDPKTPLMRNGVFPENFKESEYVDIYMREHSYTNEPLTFTELCTFNSWFTLHPEKVCGKQVITSSREFPLAIKGTKEQIIQTITDGIGQSPLITKLAEGWKVSYYDPTDEDLFIEYIHQNQKIYLYKSGIDYNLQIHQGDILKENTNYINLQDANAHIISYMNQKENPIKDTELEMEALALEIELSLQNI